LASSSVSADAGLTCIMLTARVVKINKEKNKLVFLFIENTRLRWLFTQKVKRLQSNNVAGRLYLRYCASLLLFNDRVLDFFRTLRQINVQAHADLNPEIAVFWLMY